MCPSARDKAILIRQAEEDDVFYADVQQFSLCDPGGKAMNTEAYGDRNKHFILRKKEQIQEATLHLEKMVCASEELDRRLDQQKREFSRNLERLYEIHRLLDETDEFLAEQEKRIVEYKKETKHRRQQQMVQSEDLLRIIMCDDEEDPFESVPVDELLWS